MLHTLMKRSLIKLIAFLSILLLLISLYPISKAFPENIQPDNKLDTKGYPGSIAVGDFNGDGLKDLAVANSNNTSISIFFQNKENNFNTYNNMTLSTPYRPKFIAAGDINNDKLDDLGIVFKDSNMSLIYYQLPNHTFSPDRNITLSTGFRAECIAIGDLNNDGNNDVIIVDWNLNIGAIYLQNENNTIEKIPYFNLKTQKNPSFVRIDDLNGDKLNDVIIANHFSNTTSIYIQKSNNSFLDLPDFILGKGNDPYEEWPISVATGDLNNDGFKDIAVANELSSSVTIYYQNSNYTFNRTPDKIITYWDWDIEAGIIRTDSMPQDVFIEDLNDDGLDDLAVLNLLSHVEWDTYSNVTIYYQQEDNQLNEAVSIVLLTEDFPERFIITDLNNDSHPDIAVSNFFGESVTIYYYGSALKEANEYPKTHYKKQGSHIEETKEILMHDYICYIFELDGGDKVSVNIEVINGSGVDVLLMDENNFNEFERLISYNYLESHPSRVYFADIYGYESGFFVNIRNATFEIQIPIGQKKQKYYLLIDNTEYVPTKSENGHLILGATPMGNVTINVKLDVEHVFINTLFLTLTPVLLLLLGIYSYNYYTKYRRVKKFCVLSSPDQADPRKNYLDTKKNICKMNVRFNGTKSCFLAYPFKQKLFKNNMNEIKQGIKNKFKVLMPLDKPHDTILFCDLCEMIFSTNLIVCEATQSNRNVMFEYGYAKGIGRRGVLLVNKSFNKNNRAEILSKRFGIKHFEYAQPQDVSNELSKMKIRRKLLPLIRSSNFTGKGNCEKCKIKQKKNTAVILNTDYHIKKIVPFTQRILIEKGIKLIHSKEDVHLLCRQCNAIKSAEYVIGIFASDKFDPKEEENSIVSFFLGFALGLGKKVIILQEKPKRYKMTDMKPIIKEFETITDIDNILYDLIM